MHFLLCLMIIPFAGGVIYSETDTEFWYKLGGDEITKALKIIRNEGIAKNVILFLGDGMGISTLTAARILKGQNAGRNGEEGSLVFENFPHVGVIKTYNVDKQVPDSAGTGTAFVTGVKTNMGVLGFNAKVKRGNCEASQQSGTRVTSIAEWALSLGKDAGVVTTSRITHATPAALYAKSADRNWECDSKTPAGCKDIGRQLVEDSPGNRFKVIMGGGRQQLQALPKVSQNDPIDEESCRRNDNKDLAYDWQMKRREKGDKYKFVQNKEELDNVNTEDTDYLLGIFANGHLPYEKLRDTSTYGSPSLSEMVVKALGILSKNDKGFVLLVEGARIDHAHHKTKPHLALEETLEFEEAVRKTLNFVDTSETLVLVTADHSHTMTINGYPARGNPILGKTNGSDDNLLYTTLSYANGPGANATYTVVDGKVVRSDLSGVDTEQLNYVSQSMVQRADETHSGEDVLLYAKGPMAHLFHSLHEQSYIAHVISYAACIGPLDLEHCRARFKMDNSAVRFILNPWTMVLSVLVWAYHNAAN